MTEWVPLKEYVELRITALENGAANLSGRLAVVAAVVATVTTFAVVVVNYLSGHLP